MRLDDIDTRPARNEQYVDEHKLENTSKMTCRYVHVIHSDIHGLTVSISIVVEMVFFFGSTRTFAGFNTRQSLRR